MKAAIIKGIGQAPTLSEISAPVSDQQSVLVNVKASALSNVTKARSMGTHYSSANDFPRTAGMDGVGTLANGKRVYFANSMTGSLAEQTLVDQKMLISLPDNLSDHMAAAIANPGMSSYAALVYRAQIKPGDVVLINGATGTAGVLAVAMAYTLGAEKVIVTGRGYEQLKSVNADAYLATDSFDLADQAGQVAYMNELGKLTTDVTIVLDYLFGDTATLIINSLAKTVGGAHRIRYIEIGAIAGQDAKISGAALRSSKIEIMGSGLRSVDMADMYTTLQNVFRLAAENQWNVPIATFTLDQISTAWSAPNAPRPVIAIS